MTNLEMTKEEFQEFKKLSEPDRTKKLKMLKIKLEQHYNVDLSNENKKNKEEYKLYIDILKIIEN